MYPNAIKHKGLLVGVVIEHRVKFQDGIRKEKCKANLEASSFLLLCYPDTIYFGATSSLTTAPTHCTCPIPTMIRLYTSCQAMLEPVSSCSYATFRINIEQPPPGQSHKVDVYSPPPTPPHPSELRVTLVLPATAPTLLYPRADGKREHNRQCVS